LSWTFAVTAPTRDAFVQAVDAAVSAGQDSALPGVDDQVQAAKTSLKHLITAVSGDGPFSGSAHGHARQAEEGTTYYNGLSTNVSCA
jgi:hypothetical protein